MERSLKSKNATSESPNNDTGSSTLDPDKDSPESSDSKAKRPQLDNTILSDETAVYSPTPARCAISFAVEKKRITDHPILVNHPLQPYRPMCSSILSSRAATANHTTLSMKPLLGSACSSIKFPHTSSLPYMLSARGTCNRVRGRQDQC